MAYNDDGGTRQTNFGGFIRYPSTNGLPKRLRKSDAGNKQEEQYGGFHTAK